MNDARLDNYITTSVMPLMLEHGYTVQGVFAVRDGQTSFCYTIGLTAHGWPELIVLGPCEMGGELLNRLVEHLMRVGEEPTAGELPDFLGTGYALRLRECAPFTGNFPFSMAGILFGRDEVRGLQVLLPDDEGRYPGEDGARDLTWQQLIASPEAVGR